MHIAHAMVKKMAFWSRIMYNMYVSAVLQPSALSTTMYVSNLSNFGMYQ